MYGTFRRVLAVNDFVRSVESHIQKSRSLVFLDCSTGDTHGLRSFLNPFGEPMPDGDMSRGPWLPSVFEWYDTARLRSSPSRFWFRNHRFLLSLRVVESCMRSVAVMLSLLVISPLVTGFSGVASAQDALTVDGVAFTEAGEPMAMYHAWGIHFMHNAQWSYVCRDAHPSVRSIVRTGLDRLLVGGVDGALLTLSQGCKWQQTSGSFAFETVVGLGRDPSHFDRVLIAYGKPGVVIVSNDGGHTAADDPVLAVANVEFTSMIMNGEVVVVYGHSNVDATRRLWWSRDAGVSFQAHNIGEGPTLRPWAATPSDVWLSEAANILRLGYLDSEPFPVVELAAEPRAVAIEDGQRLWFALGPHGLWHLDKPTQDEDTAVASTELTLERDEFASWVGTSTDGLWFAAGIAAWEQPILYRRSSSADWEAKAWLTPDLQPPPNCASLSFQQCMDNRSDLQGLMQPAELEPDDMPEGPQKGESGCAMTARRAPSYGVYLAVWILLLSTRYRAGYRPSVLN